MLEHDSEGLLICRIGCAKRRHGRQSYPTSTLTLPLCGMLVVCRIAKQRVQELRIRDPRKYSLLVRRQGLRCPPGAARRLPAMNAATPLLVTIARTRLPPSVQNILDSRELSSAKKLHSLASPWHQRQPFMAIATFRCSQP